MLSVIIPHFNQHDALGRCLRALMPQAAAIGAQVIVVDNGSDLFPSALVAAFPGVRLVAQPDSGPGLARNLGVAVSTGDRLAFIDADCRPAPDWIAQVLAGLDAAPICGGDVRVLCKDAFDPTQWEAYEAEFAYRMEHYIRDQGFTGTGNLAMRRSVFDAVGGFKGIDVAEDRDWGQRATAKGYQIAWCPQMRVYHPARDSFAELARKWDRMIAHDAQGVRTARDRMVWGAKAVALAASPLFALPRILRSARIPSGARGKWRAFFGLTAIRTYRAGRMLSLLARPQQAHAARRWRRSD